MATKKFNQMTTKKLNALMATASDEDKAAIEAVLAARVQAQAEETPAATEETQAEETPTAVEGEAVHDKKLKMTDEERHALAEELKANINHRCQAVPFNTAEWVDGYIAGVIEEKRSNKVLYAIKTDDGRRIVKVHDSNLVRILDEVVVPEKKARTRKAKKDGDVEKVEWTPEAIAEEVNKVIGNVGKTVEIEKYRTADENGEEHIETISGRIVAIVPDKRVSSVLYRISVPTPTEVEPNATKTIHKVSTAAITIEPDFDEIGADMNAKAVARRENAVNKVPTTPEDKLKKAQELVIKAEETLAKAQASLADRKAALEVAQQEFDAWAASQESLD